MALFVTSFPLPIFESKIWCNRTTALLVVLVFSGTGVTIYKCVTDLHFLIKIQTDHLSLVT